MRNVLSPLFLLLILIPLHLFSQDQELKIKKGEVVDNLPLNDSISETFALYIPEKYEDDRRWPVILIFDPDGEGAEAVRRFKNIADEQKYLIAGLNYEIKNDSLQEHLPYAGSLINKVMRSFRVNPGLIYAAGMGDGAELATAIPLIYKNIRGVLAVGSAWVNPQFIKQHPAFMYSILAGDEDSNYFQLKNFIDYFDKANYPNEIISYAGRNKEWPNNYVLSDAVTGFTLRDIKDKLREQDREFIAFLFNNELENAKRFERRRNYFGAFKRFKQIQEKYKDFEIGEERLKNTLKELRRNTAFRQQRRDYQEAIEFEELKKEEYMYLMEMDILQNNFENIGWWAYELEELQKKAAENMAAENVALRLTDYANKLSEAYFDQLQGSEAAIDTKVFVSVLRTAIAKNDPEAYLKIIELAGHDGDYETALLYLEDLLITGYDDMESLYEIEGILDLKLSPSYNNLIREYLGEAKYYKAQVEESDNEKEGSD